MSMIIHFANMVFKPIINLGAAPMMMIVLTLIALCFKVKFSKALEGGIKLAIALTAIGSVIGVLTTNSKMLLTHSLNQQASTCRLPTLDGLLWQRLRGVLRTRCIFCW